MEKSLNEIFLKEYSRLNDEQKDAVDSIEGPVMVIAGPGTGKTTILSLRIANILRITDTPPSGILAITYTDSGVKSMRSNLRRIIGARADEVRIHTFHGFAESMMSEFPEHFPALAKAVQMSEPEAMEIVRNIIQDKKFTDLRPMGAPEMYVDKILSYISTAKREAWTPDIIKSFAKEEINRIKNDEDSVSTRGASKGKLKAEALKKIEKCEKTLLFADVYLEYEEKKKLEDKKDYDDLIFELVKSLKNDELFLRLVQEKFLYVLVDEHQDTNESQNLIIRTIADFFENPNLFVVGDEKQAIYRFQGASVENFLKFQNIWPSMKIISLKANYRSHQTILDAGFSMIESNYSFDEYKNLRIALEAGSKIKTKPIEVVSAGNEQASINYLIEELRQKSKESKTVAVITRKNHEVYKMARILRSAGLNISADKGSDIFSHRIGILFFELINYIASPSAYESLAKSLAGDLWNLDFNSRVELIKKIESGDLSAVESKIPELAKIRKSLVSIGPIEFIINLANVSGLTKMATNDPLSMEVWRALVALSNDLAHRGNIQDPVQLIESLQNYRTGAKTKNVRIPIGEYDCNIRIMTAHRSKGLEFDYVYIINATEDSWISNNNKSFFVVPHQKDDKDDLRDARRLFYVALTRAKEHLSIIFSKEAPDGKQLIPVRFIDELNENNLSRVDVPASLKVDDINKSVDQVEKAFIERNQYIKNVLMEKGISVTALNHFIECPNQFYFKSILRVPEPPTMSSEKGTAIHEAIRLAWISFLDKTPVNVENLEKIISSGTEGYLQKSLLNKKDKERVTDELKEDIPVMAKSMLGHFSEPIKSSEKVSLEKWFDTEFEGIKLHGRLDTVIETESEIKVFDYKTGKHQSLAEIKGETKNADGKYFRQLAFYSLLIGSKEIYKNKHISTSLMFVKPDSKGQCPVITLPINDSDIEDIKKKIKELINFVQTGKIASVKCDNSECEYCAIV